VVGLEDLDVRMTRVAVIGAGWAGATAALTLARAGIHVTAFEANSIAGGRARVVEKSGHLFDNGQHLLLGAYARSLAMIDSLHAAHSAHDAPYLRLPLMLQSAPNTSLPLSLAAPNLPAPIHLLAAIIGAKGFSFTEKLAAAWWAARHLRDGSISAAATVSQVIEKQPARVRRLLWEPLCVAALNTPPDVASASVFVEVLKRSFMGDARGSDLIIPRVNLTALLPEPALKVVRSMGGEVWPSTYVTSVATTKSGATVRLRDESTQAFDFVIMATGPQHLPRLLSEVPAALEVVERTRTLTYEPITTLHFDFSYRDLGQNHQVPMHMLDGSPGQWVFWHSLANGHWRASVVISVDHRAGSESCLISETLSQLRRSYRLPTPLWQFVVTEKRATYSCTPSQCQILTDIPRQIGRLVFAGDWCVSELPATLEAAVISGERAAQIIILEVNHD
jgi:squalene-associated FAD-dependent desaturase